MISRNVFNATPMKKSCLLLVPIKIKLVAGGIWYLKNDGWYVKAIYLYHLVGIIAKQVRISLSLEESLLKQLASMQKKDGYENRSDIRNLIRSQIVGHFFDFSKNSPSSKWRIFQISKGGANLPSRRILRAFIENNTKNSTQRKRGIDLKIYSLLSNFWASSNWCCCPFLRLFLARM